MPKAPAPKPLPSTPTSASFISRQTQASLAKANRPNKLMNPALGASRSNVGAPTLLGGA